MLLEGYNGMYSGFRVIFDTVATENTEVRNFPISKNRSKRILKKLLKRFGGFEFKQKPCILLDNRSGRIIVHPALKEEFLRAIKGAEDATRKKFI